MSFYRVRKCLVSDDSNEIDDAEVEVMFATLIHMIASYVKVR